MRLLSIEKNASAVALIMAALFLAASTFYWQNGEYSVTAATLLILSIFFWIPALQGLFATLKIKYPRYAVYGFWVAVLGCVSGICFAFLGYLTTIFNIQHEQYLATLAQHPFSSQLLLFASGPLFPLSIIVLGIMLAFSKQIPSRQGIVFSLAGVLFPVSRISRNQLIGHGADLVFLVACLFIAIELLKKK